MHKLLIFFKKKKLTISCAESLSGGYLSYLFTKIPGSSKVFKGSIVAYSLEAKHKFFNIALPLLEKYDGVSADICKALAIGVRKLFNTDIGLALVGYAGPETKNKVKVGTVFLAISSKKQDVVKKIIFKGSRNKIRQDASIYLVNLLYKLY